MAKKFARTEQTYPAGTYGPFNINTLNAQQFLALDMTIVGWPNVDPLAKVTLKWLDGSGATFTIAGDQKDKTGAQKTSGTLRVSVPRNSAGNAVRNTAGSVTIEVFAPITTALNLRAV